MSQRSLNISAVLVFVLVTGCQDKPNEEPTNAQKPPASPLLRVVVVDDPVLARTIERQWKARTEGRIDVQQMQSAELVSARQLIGDVVIYPSECLGTMVERDLISPLTTGTRRDPQLASQDVMELQRNAETRWGENTYAVSFGSPQLVLFYRADIMEQLDLNPPSTWDEYQQLAAKLTRAELGDQAPPADHAWSPTIEPLADGWAGKALLARAAAYAKAPSQFSAIFDYVTMEPLIAGPPFVRAMKQLIAAAKLGPTDRTPCDPRQAKQAFFAGEAAMVWSWPSAAHADSASAAHAESASAAHADSRLSLRESSEENVAVEERKTTLPEGFQVGFAELPGAIDAFDFGEGKWTKRRDKESMRVALIGVAGRLGSVTRNARHAQDAANMLVWLSGKEWSSQIAPASPATTLYRKSQMANPALWTDSIVPRNAAEQYAELVLTTQSRPSRISSIRILEWHRYLAALDKAVRESLTDHKTPEDALADAAAEWTAITREIGTQQQQAAYTRSLGLEP